MSDKIHWNCKHCGALIGYVVRKKIAERPANLQVLECLDGHDHAGLGRVPCPECGHKRVWEPGRVMLEEVIAASGRELLDDDRAAGTVICSLG